MRWSLTILTVLASLAAVSCNNAKLIKFADFHYRVSCREGAMTGHGCVANVRDINNSDGTDGVRIPSCKVSRTGANPSLAFRVQNTVSGTTFGVSVSGLFYTAADAQTAGGANAMGGGSCSFTLSEGGNDFTGHCGPAAPSAAIPCQITGIRESYDNLTDMNPQIEGDIVCAHLTNVSAPTEIREVDADTTTPLSKFHFRVVFCDGVMAMGV